MKTVVIATRDNCDMNDHDDIIFLKTVIAVRLLFCNRKAGQTLVVLYKFMYCIRELTSEITVASNGFVFPIRGDSPAMITF